MVGVAYDQCPDTDLEDLWGEGVMAMYTGQQPGAQRARTNEWYPLASCHKLHR